VIEECYRASDDLVGQAMEACGDDTTLVVLSDHGFVPYYRSFNLNSWLARNDYLLGVEPWQYRGDIFGNADWRNTLAYGMGFNSLYFNMQGREPYGIVGREEGPLLAAQLAEELRQVRDPDTGDRVIDNVYVADEVYSPARVGHAPDMVIGYAPGYRCSDDSVLGKITEKLTEDNLDKWSGDHCIDRSRVPGIFLTNRSIAAEAPELIDLTVTVLEEFGVEPLREMTGRPVLST
jgi:predicted AlkP superfamily phosphohydrolase/phosphomutase